MANYSRILPGGKFYQRSGLRLENAIYNQLPNTIKKYITKNYKLKKINGDTIVEYDLLYENKKNIISFEIKGINEETSFNKYHYDKLIKQAKRQVESLDNLNTSKKKLVIYCFVTGTNINLINPQLLNELTKLKILVSVGTTPGICINNVYNILNKHNLLT